MKAVIGALCALGMIGALAQPVAGQTQAPAAAAAKSGATQHPTIKHPATKHVPIKHELFKHPAQNHGAAGGSSGGTTAASGQAQANAKDLAGPKASDYTPKTGTQGKP